MLSRCLLQIVNFLWPVEMLMLPTSVSLYNWVLSFVANLMRTVSYFVNMKIGCWKKKRFIEQYNTDIVFPCHEEIRSVKTERHPNCVLWIFLELHVAAAWQKCDMFSFGEIPTFKRYRGGADRYRLYEHEFPSREYNLPAWRSHDFVLVTSSCSCIKKNNIFLTDWIIDEQYQL